MEYVLGVDLGTSAVKVSLISSAGEVEKESSAPLTLEQEFPGHSEQNPEEWVNQTYSCIRDITSSVNVNSQSIKGISFSGQMHGLVLLDRSQKVLRPAILWNDTRTVKEVKAIQDEFGESFTNITGNKPLEGFTLPKLLWIRRNEPMLFAQISKILLPKDYLRFRMTGKIQMEISDAAGTVLMNVRKQTWSGTIAKKIGIPKHWLPELINSTDYVGLIQQGTSVKTGLNPDTKVFGGAADNVCGALAAGILDERTAMCSIGTSGVVLAYEPSSQVDYHGELHFFNHAVPNSFYSMGVTLAAGYSLNWLKQMIASKQSVSEFVESARLSSVGANGLMFTPYIVGERTPYPDATIRGSFIGLGSGQSLPDFVRAVLEGVSFSFKDILNLYRKHNRSFEKVIVTGGGSKSSLWVQILSDVLNLPVLTLKSSQGPSLGAGMIAMVGLGWYSSLKKAVENTVRIDEEYLPRVTDVQIYERLYKVYQQIYPNTKDLTKKLQKIQEEIADNNT